LRLYNPGPSRWYQFALTDPTGTTQFPFWQISSDGNLLPNAVKVTNIARRYAHHAKHWSGQRQHPLRAQGRDPAGGQQRGHGIPPLPRFAGALRDALPQCRARGSCDDDPLRRRHDTVTRLMEME
jgi:hypothetical protein